MPSLPRRPASRTLGAALLIAFAAQLLFGWNITRASKLAFDEVHYVPAARTLLALEQPANTEHPLLGKALIASGIAMFGDTPLGWRAMSAVAGTATVLGAFAILMLAFGSIRTASYGALFVAINFTQFVHARIAMLEPFLGAFVVLGIAALLWARTAPADRVVRRWLLGATLLGCATAVKWTAAPYVAFTAVGFLILRRQGGWKGLGAVKGVVLLGATSIAAYLLSFLPAFFYTREALTLDRLIPFQLEMLHRQTQRLPSHTYQSHWTSWPLETRPMWYFYEPVDGAVRGIFYVGNPVVMWGGLLAVAWLAWHGWRRRSATAGAIALLWAGSWGMWAMIPKSLGFYYYYHLSGIVLGIALAAAFHLSGHVRTRYWFAVAAGVAFIWFYPILSAAPLHDAQSFNRWMWFDSWR